MMTRPSSQECDTRKRLLDLLTEQLKKMHACGVLHNDIELRNVVCNGEKLAFIDFDAAVILKDGVDYERKKQAEMWELERLEHEFWHATEYRWQCNIPRSIVPEVGRTRSL